MLVTYMVDFIRPSSSLILWEEKEKWFLHDPSCCAWLEEIHVGKFGTNIGFRKGRCKRLLLFFITLGVCSSVLLTEFWIRSAYITTFFVEMSNFILITSPFLPFLKEHFLFYSLFYSIVTMWQFKIFTLFRVLKMNGLELKFQRSIPTIGRHVSIKGNLKIQYFVASIFTQIRLLCTLTSWHWRWFSFHFFREIWSPSSPYKWPNFILISFMIFYFFY